MTSHVYITINPFNLCQQSFFTFLYIYLKKNGIDWMNRSRYLCTGNLIDSNNITCTIILIVWINEWSDFVFVIIKNIFICEINRHLIVFRKRVDFFLLVNTCTVLKRKLHSFFFLLNRYVVSGHDQAVLSHYINENSQWRI